VHTCEEQFCFLFTDRLLDKIQNFVPVFGAMYYSGDIRDSIRGIEWESRFHVRILVLADCPNHEIFYCILQRRQMGLAGHV
jgi:hypothetical protein